MMMRSLKSMAVLQITGNLGCVYLVVITALICFGVLPGCNSYATGSMDGLNDEFYDADETLLGVLSHAGRHNHSQSVSQKACGGDLDLVPPVKFVPWVLYWKGNVGDAASVLSIYVFAFACTQSVPPIMAELKDCTIRRVDAVSECIGLSCSI
jgi:amino acid permease